MYLAMLSVMRERNSTELIGVALSIIGLIMGLAAVKAGASLLVCWGSLSLSLDWRLRVGAGNNVSRPNH
jgi:hypothetical protein